MKKVFIKMKINDYNIENEGILNNNLLKFQDKDDFLTFDIKNQILIKENKETKMIMDFKKQELVYTLIKEDVKFNHKFIILSLTNEDKQVNIIYQIEGTDFNLLLNYETI